MLAWKHLPVVHFIVFCYHFTCLNTKYITKCISGFIKNFLLSHPLPLQVGWFYSKFTIWNVCHTTSDPDVKQMGTEMQRPVGRTATTEFQKGKAFRQYITLRGKNFKTSCWRRKKKHKGLRKNRTKTKLKKIMWQRNIWRFPFLWKWKNQHKE